MEHNDKRKREKKRERRKERGGEEKERGRKEKVKGKNSQVIFWLKLDSSKKPTNQLSELFSLI